MQGFENSAYFGRKSKSAQMFVLTTNEEVDF